MPWERPLADRGPPPPPTSNSGGRAQKVPAGLCSLDGFWGLGWEGAGGQAPSPHHSSLAQAVPHSPLPLCLAASRPPLRVGPHFSEAPSQHPHLHETPVTVLTVHPTVPAHTLQSTPDYLAFLELGAEPQCVSQGTGLGLRLGTHPPGPWDPRGGTVFSIFRGSRRRGLRPGKQNPGWVILQPVLLGPSPLTPQGPGVSGKYTPLEGLVAFAPEAKTPRQDAVESKYLTVNSEKVKMPTALSSLVLETASLSGG